MHEPAYQFFRNILLELESQHGNQVFLVRLQSSNLRPGPLYQKQIDVEEAITTSIFSPRAIQTHEPASESSRTLYLVLECPTKVRRCSKGFEKRKNSAATFLVTRAVELTICMDLQAGLETEETGAVDGGSRGFSAFMEDKTSNVGRAATRNRPGLQSFTMDQSHASASRKGGDRSTVGPPEAWASFRLRKDGSNHFRAVFHKLLRH
jgi:hypothetical protein